MTGMANKVLVDIKSNENPTKSNNSNSEDTVTDVLVAALARDGMAPPAIANILNGFLFLNEKLSVSHVLEILAKVLKHPESGKLPLTELVKGYIEMTDGEFTLRDICDFLELDRNKSARNKISSLMCRFVKDRLVTREGKKNGVFRKVDKNVEAMDFISAKDEDTDLWLPFGLSDMVSIMPGNIILIAGEPNAGKTALCLNMVRYNMERWNVTYFNSEMGALELKKRLSHFDDLPLSDWKFKAYERSDRFEDVIVPGIGNLNIIDYMELHEEHYLVSKYLSQIHSRLDGAIAVVCLQKNPGTDYGLGGLRSMEKPRLALAIKPGATKIVKAKNWKGNSMNPNGLMIRWKLSAGCWFSTQGEWYKDPGGKKGGKI